MEDLYLIKCESPPKRKCPQSWHSLDLTDDIAIRRCQVCQQDVHFCFNDDDIKRHTKEGRGIAFENPAYYDDRDRDNIEDF